MLVEESSIQWWSKWEKQTTELHILQADAENWRKEGDEFYKMDAESMVTLREELADDFLSLADEQLAVVWRLVEQLDDDEWERRRQEVAKRTTTINISDEEQSSEQVPNASGIGGSQPSETQGKQPKEDNP